MKKALLFAGIILALTASVAMAAGVSVSWKNYCWGEAGSTNSLTWACTTNSNANIRMTTSFKIDAPTPDFNGVGVFMEGQTAATAVPDWWKMGSTPDCRAGAIAVYADGSILANQGADVCFDIWTPYGGGGGGLGLYSWDTNRMHVNAAWALADAIPLEANTEYFAVQFRVQATKTAGTGSCTGCTTPAVWGLTKIDWTTPTTINTLDTPYLDGNQCLWWQTTSANLDLKCQKPVPVRNTTWGQVKSLYR